MMCVIGWYVCVLVTVSRSEHWRISVVEYKGSESNTSSHQSVSGASKKIVLPSILDTFFILHDVKLALLSNNSLE